MIKITEQVSIPEEELKFSASRSSGPGGQRVNKVSTRVTLRFDVANSPSLSPTQKDRILTRLATRVSKSGELRVVSQQTRSQAANREVALERFIQLLQQTFRQTAYRVPTRISLTARRRRLEEKKHRSRLKQKRSKRVSIED